MLIVLLILGPVFLPGIGNQKTFVQRKENTGGVGYDLSGFVKTKAAGERILAMVHEVLGTDKCETYLDLVNQLGFNLSSSLASLT